MAFTAKDVQNLRERTGAGMMDCKKALTASDGDFDKAVEFLREKGLAAAAKKAGRVAAEGMVYAGVCDECGVGAMVEVNSETDFVAKNEVFQKFVKDLATVVMKENPADLEALKACQYPEEGKTVAEVLTEKVATIGENIQIRRFVRFCEGTQNVAYMHMGGKIGVLVALEVSDNLKGNAVVSELGHDVCMQIAAMNPQYLNRDSVPAEVVEHEKEILMAQTINEGKPEAVAQKIVNGRINKFFEENCLVDQAFVKENKTSVSKYVDAKAKELGGTISIKNFVRFEKGEGLAKKEDDFAAEVAAMANK